MSRNPLALRARWLIPIDRPPIAILDANNLTPIAVHLVELADHTANQQERLKPE